MTKPSYAPASKRNSSAGRLLLLPGVILLLLVGSLAFPRLQSQLQALSPSPSQTPSLAPVTLTPSATASLAATSAASPTNPPALPTSAAGLMPDRQPASLPFSSLDQGLVVLAAGEGGYTHLFAYRPRSLPLTRLMDGAWDDITPAISPDGYRLAFASNRDGQWDLYMLTLPSGEITRLTDTPEYDASPTWSPDGEWLAYESYHGDGDNGNLEIYVRPVDGAQAPIRLTDDPGADYAPAWSPKGRQIAFVSTRSGENEIWLADLDRVDGRFQNLSQDSNTVEDHPTWAPAETDGQSTQLAWAATSQDGIQSIYTFDVAKPSARPQVLGSGDWAAWSPDRKSLLVSLSTPNQNYLTAYDLQPAGLALPNIPLSGPIAGLTWSNSSLPDPLPEAYRGAAQVSPTPIWSPSLTEEGAVPNGRQRVVTLADVAAPEPKLQDLVDESFQALRRRLSEETGWDFLASLENAYVPLTSPLGPGMSEDWLFTGRAFAFNPVAMNAGWLVVLREDYGPQTYWRVYLRARFQDGSQGAPLRRPHWDFTTRFEGDPRAYEQGGSLATAILPGYWVDFTSLAAAYGWQRVPALNAWRSAYTSARFNEYVMPGQQDWLTAMREIYPDEALNTPTPIPTATNTPTATPWPTKTPYMTRTPAPTRTPRPTNTPWPTATSRYALTATPTPTQAPSFSVSLP